MGQTGSLYKQTERVRELAIEAFDNLEANDEVDGLIDDMNAVIELAVAVRDVAVEVNPALSRL